MSPSTIYVGIGIFALLGLVVQFTVIWHRHHRDCREHLEPILAARGLQFVSARWPGFFKLGPFPKFEVEVGHPQSKLGGIRGEYDEYRIVTFQDSEGKAYQVWACVEFGLFRLRRVRWRADPAEDLPEAAQTLLES